MNDVAPASLHPSLPSCTFHSHSAMPKRRTLDLSDPQRRALIQVRDHHDKPYMREKAAALLKVNQGYSAHFVAQHGLLKRRDPDTVYSWLDAYQADGIEGLSVAEGRGRKPAFSP